MAKMKKIIVAGALVKEVVYPIPASREASTARQKKKQLSSAAQQRMNEKYSYQKCELMLAANFVPGDLVVTLTYEPRTMPKDRGGAMAQLKYFRAKMSKARRGRAEEFKMLWNEESLTAHGRHHHHCVINATDGEDFKEIETLWGNGRVEIQKLMIDKDHSYESLARYLCKEYAEKPGQRAWSYTRNLKKPEIESFRVDDDTPLQAPKGSVVIDKASESNSYGSWSYIKYLNFDQKPFGKKRKRKKQK